MIPQTVFKTTEKVLKDFVQIRRQTLKLFKPLRVEDAVMQSDTFGSPPNWHLAHVTWFYQKILEKYGQNIDSAITRSLNIGYLNSYYQQFGFILSKSERGKYPRPTVRETMQYRSIIDKKINEFLKSLEMHGGANDELIYHLELANNHEMQHQELMVYDLQHYFQRFPNPDDNYEPQVVKNPPTGVEKPEGMVKIPGGLYDMGFSGGGFSYDNELPVHKVFLQPYKIDISPVSNGEFMRFIEEGGYENFKFWLADGWEHVNTKKWKAPLYWEKRNGEWIKKDFRGLRRLDPDEPVVNVSYYEADAFARWAGKRLPTEAEWEKAASWNESLGRKTMYPWGDSEPTSRHANLLEYSLWGPVKIGSFPEGKSYYGCHQMIGDVWEWTASEYVLYPGFKSKFAEYTDKWVINQKVLRGGSFATPAPQIRNSYRNYFRPEDRILFAGFRCCMDL